MGIIIIIIIAIIIIILMGTGINISIHISSCTIRSSPQLGGLALTAGILCTFISSSHPRP